MNKKRIIINYIYNTAYQILVILSPLITAPYIARVLGVTGVSVVNYAFSIVTYFVLFGTVGSSLFGQREIAYYQDNPEKRSSIFKEIVIFRFVTVTVSMVVYYFTVARNSKYGLVPTFLMIELISTAFDISWFFQGLEEFKKTVIRNVVVKLFAISLIFILIKSPEDVNKYAVCFTLPTFLGNLSLWAYLPKYIVKSPVSLKSMYKYIKPMLALFLPQVAIEIYTVLDKTMIGNLSSSIDDVGYYTYAQNIVKMILQIITSLGIVMLPAMANAFAKEKHDEIKEMISSALKFVFMLGCPLMFGLMAVATSFVAWFYGEGYEPVGPLMMIVSPIILAIGISNVTGKQYLLPTKRQTIFTVSVIVGAVVNFILNLVLIPRYSAVGASIATVMAESCVALVQIVCIGKQLPFGKIFKNNIKYLLFAFIMFVAVYPLGKLVHGFWCTVLQAGVGGIIYLALLLITKEEILFKYINIVVSKIKK